MVACRRPETAAAERERKIGNKGWRVDVCGWRWEAMEILIGEKEAANGACGCGKDEKGEVTVKEILVGKEWENFILFGFYLFFRNIKLRTK